MLRENFWDPGFWGTPLSLDPVKVSQWCRIGVHGLLEESVEQHAASFGVAAVEAESVFVEVVGQVFDGDVVVYLCV